MKRHNYKTTFRKDTIFQHSIFRKYTTFLTTLKKRHNYLDNF